MFGKKKPPPIKSLIAQGTRVEGHVHFLDGLRLDGEVTGSVVACEERPSILVVSEHAVIDGGVTADHIIINGRVNGPVRARHMLELQPKARIHGDVTYQGLEMHLGSMVHGTLIPALEQASDSEPQIPPQASVPNADAGNS